MANKMPFRHVTHLVEETPDIYSEGAKIRIETWDRGIYEPGKPTVYSRDEWFVDLTLAKKIESRFEDGTICGIVDILKEEEGEQLGLDY